MIKTVVIRQERDDLARVDDLITAFNLVGGQGDGSGKNRAADRTPAEHEAKLFGSIRGGSFTYDQVLEAVAIIKRRRTSLIASLSDPVFLDPKLQKTWADGIRGNANHAVRLAERFLDDLKQDMSKEAESSFS